MISHRFYHISVNVDFRMDLTIESRTVSCLYFSFTNEIILSSLYINSFVTDFVESNKYLQLFNTVDFYLNSIYTIIKLGS